jgi:serine/threonine protein phosphatase PrpC
VSSHALLSTGLRHLSEYILPDYKEALETLLVYTKNLIENPEEKKFKQVKISNIHFQERLGRFHGSTESMNAVGFIECGDFMKFEHSLTAERIAILKDMREVLIQRIEGLNKQYEHLPKRLPENHRYSSVAGAAALGEIGKRNDMEDDDLIIDSFSGVQSSGFFALYDGHGGRQSVDYVVKVLHLNLEQELKKNPSMSLEDAFTNAYLATDAQLLRQKIIRSGTTAVTCLLRTESSGSRMLYSANVGDSRAILCRGNRAIRLTIDHKANDPEEAKRVQEAGGYIGRNQRVNGVLAISRALGDHLFKDNDVVSARPFCKTVELLEQDNFLILACDGYSFTFRFA